MLILKNVIMRLCILIAVIFLQTNISAQKRDCNNLYGYWEIYNEVLPYSAVYTDTISAKWSFRKDNTVSDTYNIKQFTTNDDCTKLWMDNIEFDIIKLSKDTLVISRYIFTYRKEKYWCKRIDRGLFEKGTEYCDEIVEIIKHKKVQDYLHPNLPGRNTLYLLSNKYCRLGTQIGELYIKSLSEELLHYYKNYIKIISIMEKEQGQEIHLSYPIEGAVFIAQLDKEGKVVDVEVTE